MATIDRIRQVAAVGLMVASGACLHVGLDTQVVMAQTMVPGYSPQYVPKHEITMPGFGLPTAPAVPDFGVGPVLPSPASPHSRTPSAYFPMVPDSRLTFGAALAADSRARGGFGYGGYGYGGYGYWGMGASTSLPPMPEFGPGTYRAGNQFPDSAVGRGMAGGNPADPAAGNAGRIPIGAASEDAFDNAANGRPSAARPVRSNRVTAARRPSSRKPAPQPSSKVEARGADAATSWLGAPRAQPQQADRPRERPSAVRSEETKSAPRRSMLGPSH